MRSILTALTIGVFALATTATAPAQAGAGNGASVQSYTDCSPLGSGQYCFALHGMSNDTTTPSGGENHVLNSKATLTFTSSGGQVVFQETQDSHHHALIKDGATQEEGGGLTYTITFNGQTCKVPYVTHYANGQYQFMRGEVKCS
jgi:hypothetical protein